MVLNKVKSLLLFNKSIHGSSHIFVVFENKIKAQAHTDSGTCLKNEGENVQITVLIAVNFHN